MSQHISRFYFYELCQKTPELNLLYTSFYFTTAGTKSLYYITQQPLFILRELF